MRSIVGRTTGPDPGAFFFFISPLFSLLIYVALLLFVVLLITAAHSGQSAHPWQQHTESFRLGCFSFLVFISISISSFNCVASCIICGRTQRVDCWDKAAAKQRHHRYAFCIVALAIVSQFARQSVRQPVSQLVSEASSLSIVCSFTQPATQSVSHSSVHP